MIIVEAQQEEMTMTKATLTMIDSTTGAEILAMALPERHAASISGNICYDYDVAKAVEKAAREHFGIPEGRTIGFRWATDGSATECRETGPKEFTTTFRPTLTQSIWEKRDGVNHGRQDPDGDRAVTFVRVNNYNS
jgi:hypothetical protein